MSQVTNKVKTSATLMLTNDQRGRLVPALLRPQVLDRDGLQDGSITRRRIDPRDGSSDELHLGIVHLDELSDQGLESFSGHP